MEPTYEGCLEGSLSSISRHIRKEDWIRQRASRLLPRRLPLIVVDSPDEELPVWFCVAELNFHGECKARCLGLCFTTQSLLVHGRYVAVPGYCPQKLSFHPSTGRERGRLRHYFFLSSWLLFLPSPQHRCIVAVGKGRCSMKRLFLVLTAIGLFTPWMPLQADEASYEVLPFKTVDGPKSLMLERYLLELAEKSTRRAKQKTMRRSKQAKTRWPISRGCGVFFSSNWGFPERTPLEARTTATIERDGYRVEMVLFASRPGFHVTGLLFLPPGKALSGILVPCGHSSNGKGEEKYQTHSASRSPNKEWSPFVMTHSGREKESGAPAKRQTRAPITPFSASVASRLEPISHQFRIWDGMRALDYLASRPEVDLGGWDVLAILVEGP